MTSLMYCSAQDVADRLNDGRSIVTADGNESVFQISADELNDIIKQATQEVIQRTVTYFPLTAFRYTETHKIPLTLPNGFHAGQQRLQNGFVHRVIKMASFTPGFRVESLEIEIPNRTTVTIPESNYNVKEEEREITFSERTLSGVWAQVVLLRITISTPGLQSIPLDAKNAAANIATRNLLPRYADKVYKSQNSSKLSVTQKSADLQERIEKDLSKFTRFSQFNRAHVSFLEDDQYDLITESV